MDAFEAHTMFKDMLKKNLSASQIGRISTFAYQNSEHYDGLFQVLIATLNETSILSRLNYFYIVDNLYKHSGKSGFDGYFELISDHLDEIIRTVIDYNPKAQNVETQGLANVQSVKKVLSLWKSKSLISPTKYSELVDFLNSVSGKSSHHSSTVSKESALKRMEDDRERMKRAREDSWHYNYSIDHSEEFLHVWQKAKPLTDLSVLVHHERFYDQ